MSKILQRQKFVLGEFAFHMADFQKARFLLVQIASMVKYHFLTFCFTDIWSLDMYQRQSSMAISSEMVSLFSSDKVPGKFLSSVSIVSFVSFSNSWRSSQESVVGIFSGLFPSVWHTQNGSFSRSEDAFSLADSGDAQRRSSVTSSASDISASPVSRKESLSLVSSSGSRDAPSRDGLGGCSLDAEPVRMSSSHLDRIWELLVRIEPVSRLRSVSRSVADWVSSRAWKQNHGFILLTTVQKKCLKTSAWSYHSKPHSKFDSQPSKAASSWMSDNASRQTKDLYWWSLTVVTRNMAVQPIRTRPVLDLELDRFL